MQHGIIRQGSQPLVRTIPSLHCNMTPKAKAKATAKAIGNVNAIAIGQQTPDTAKPRGKVGVMQDKGRCWFCHHWDMSQPGKPMGQLSAQYVKGNLQAVKRKGKPQPLDPYDSRRKQGQSIISF